MPFFGVMLLTLIVWIYMYIRRTSYLLREKIDLRKVDTPEKAADLVPADVSLASHNLKNLFELPVLFYAIGLYLIATGQGDAIDTYCAWTFLAFRVVHSFIHCSYNNVMHRFAAYLVASLALWVMVVRAFIGAL